MRYEDWTFREAEVRLGEHRELRLVLGLPGVAAFTDVVSLPAASRRPWRGERLTRPLWGACTIIGKNRCRRGS